MFLSDAFLYVMLIRYLQVYCKVKRNQFFAENGAGVTQACQKKQALNFFRKNTLDLP